MGGSLPLGVVLAGGRGRRLGGAKATAQLCGRPLISYPLTSLKAVLDEVVIVAKPDTELPALGTVDVWLEQDTRQHPLVGLLEALALARGRTLVVCAVDLPLVTAELVGRLAFAEPQSAVAVVASHNDQSQPLLGRYSAGAIGRLREADPSAPLREAVSALSPVFVEVADPLELFNVNTPEDLGRAEESLCG